MAPKADLEAPGGRQFIVGSDHAGRGLKDRLKLYLAEGGNRVEDLSPEGEQIEYPVVCEDVGRAVAQKEDACGLLVCGTGIGASIAANKVNGIRAALLYSEEAAQYARRHNDANVLVFGGRTMAFEQARRCIEAFFAQQFEGGRHSRRNEFIKAIEGRSCGPAGDL